MQFSLGRLFRVIAAVAILCGIWCWVDPDFSSFIAGWNYKYNDGPRPADWPYGFWSLVGGFLGDFIPCLLKAAAGMFCFSFVFWLLFGPKVEVVDMRGKEYEGTWPVYWANPENDDP